MGRPIAAPITASCARPTNPVTEVALTVVHRRPVTVVQALMLDDYSYFNAAIGLTREARRPGK